MLRAVIMDFAAVQNEIDSILQTLDKAKRDSGLGSDDPGVIALEEIMLAKVAALEATRIVAAESKTPAPPIDTAPIAVPAANDEGTSSAPAATTRSEKKRTGKPRRAQTRPTS